MLDGESVLGAYRTMVVARTPDERCLSLQRQVRIASAAREAVRAS
jgi:TPP-dependent pyruvate/acetoin dehydrogenase alpha subunit